MNVQNALVDRLNKYKVNAEELLSLLTDYVKTDSRHDPLEVLDESKFDSFTGNWLKARYTTFEPFLCDALSARALAFMSVVRDVAVSRNPADPDYDSFWRDPDFVMAAVMTPFRNFGGTDNPLFDSRAFFQNVSLLKRVLPEEESQRNDDGNDSEQKAPS